MHALNIGLNIIWASAEQIFRIGIAFFVNLAIARSLGPTDYGTLTTVFASASFIMSLCMFGLDTVSIREISSVGKAGGRVVVETLLIRFGACIIVLVPTVIWCLAKSEHLFANYLLVVILLIPFQVIGASAGDCFSAKLMAKYITITLVTALVPATIFRVYGILTGQHLIFFIYCYFCEYFLSTLIITFFFFRLLYGTFSYWKPEISGFKRLISGAKWLLISAIVVQLLQNAGLFFMATYNPGHDLGNYAAAFRLISVTQFLPALVGQAFIPTITRLYDSKNEEIAIYENQLFRCLSLCGYGITIFCISVGPWLLPFLLGNAFNGASTTFCILSFSGIPLSMAAARSTVFSKTRNYRSILISDVTGAALTIVLSALTVAKYGSNGVAISSVIGSFIAYIGLPYLLMANDLETRKRMFSAFLFPFPNLQILFNKVSLRH